MLPGTIIMLAFVVIVVFGGSGWLMSVNLKNEKKKIAQPQDKQ